MTETHSDDDPAKITRRVFLQHSAAASIAAAGVCGIVLKTDAQADSPVIVSSTNGNGQEDFPYGYVNPPGG